MRGAFGLVLLLAGLVWTLQGFDVAWAPQSFMTGDWRWIVAGLLSVAVGIRLSLGNRSKE